MNSQSSGTPSQSTFSDSSNTTSSQSRKIELEEEDFTKDNNASPIDLECQIQTERITKILDKAIYKTKLSICLPKLVYELDTLKSILTSQHLDEVVYIFKEYENPLFSTSLMDMGAMEDIKGGDLSLRNRLNPEMAHLLYILTSYPQFKSIVKNMIDEMKANYVSYETTPPQPWLEYLLILEQFRDQIFREMKRTAAEVLAEKLKTRKMELSNEKLIKEIKESTEKIKAENERVNTTMALKTDLIGKLEKEVAQYNYEADLGLRKKILDSNRQMVLATRSHHVKYEMLKEEDNETVDGYKRMLKQNIDQEKKQRARRFKVETQLLSWVQKYDIEIGDKQVELNELTEKYEDEVQKIEDLEAKIVEQDKEFIPLMEEREKEYHQEMTNKMESFMQQHAARVIQYFWRDVLFNRAEKKRLKKLLKKKQEAEQLAARKAEIAAKKEAIAAKKEALAAKKEALAAKKEALAAKKEALAANKEQKQIENTI